MEDVCNACEILKKNNNNYSNPNNNNNLLYPSNNNLTNNTQNTSNNTSLNFNTQTRQYDNSSNNRLYDNSYNNSNLNYNQNTNLNSNNKMIGDGNEDTMEEWSGDLSKLSKKKLPFYRPIDIVQMKISLFKSIILPELAKGVKFVIFFLNIIFAMRRNVACSLQYSYLFFPTKKFFSNYSKFFRHSL